jgi:hypothetical protein
MYSARMQSADDEEFEYRVRTFDLKNAEYEKLRDRIAPEARFTQSMGGGGGVTPDWRLSLVNSSFKDFVPVVPDLVSRMEEEEHRASGPHLSTCP